MCDGHRRGGHQIKLEEPAGALEHRAERRHDECDQDDEQFLRTHDRSDLHGVRRRTPQMANGSDYTTSITLVEQTCSTDATANATDHHRPHIVWLPATDPRPSEDEPRSNCPMGQSDCPMGQSDCPMGQ